MAKLYRNYKHFTNAEYIGEIKVKKAGDKKRYFVNGKEYSASDFVKVGALDLGYAIETHWTLKQNIEYP